MDEARLHRASRVERRPARPVPTVAPLDREPAVTRQVDPAVVATDTLAAGENPACLIGDFFKRLVLPPLEATIPIGHATAPV